MRLLAELNGHGLTVLVVTHDPAVAAAASRLLLMRDGRLTEQPIPHTTGVTG